MPLYSHQDGGQNKLDDDYVDALLGLMNVFGVFSNPLSRIEKREAALPEPLRDLDNIIANGGENAERMVLARQIAFNRLDQQESVERGKLSRYRPSVPKIVIRRRPW
jgi:hypothetical protein